MWAVMELSLYTGTAPSITGSAAIPWLINIGKNVIELGQCVINLRWLRLRIMKYNLR